MTSDPTADDPREERRGFADLPLTKETLVAALYHADAFRDGATMTPEMWSDITEAMADEAWLFVRDALRVQPPPPEGTQP